MTKGGPFGGRPFFLSAGGAPRHLHDSRLKTETYVRTLRPNETQPLASRTGSPKKQVHPPRDGRTIRIFRVQRHSLGDMPNFFIFTYRPLREMPSF